MSGDRLSIHYGYGAARIPLAMPILYRAPLHQRWFLHPSVAGLVGSLVILSLLRSCVTPVTTPGRTILWLQQTPEAVLPPVAPATGLIQQAVKAPVQKPERVILTPPRPIPEILPPAPLALEKRRSASDRTVYENPREVVQMLSQAPRAALARQDRIPARQNSRITQALPEIPVPDSSYTLDRQAVSRRPGPVSGRHPAAAPSAFSPLTPEASGPSLPRSLAGGRPNAVLVPQGPSAPGAEAMAAAPLPGIQRAGGSGDLRRGETTASSPAGFTAALPDAVSAPASGRKTAATEEMVTIAGTIEGESTRIETLKLDISKKAQSGTLKPGAYCCTISGVDCRVAVTNDKRVRLTFSREVIPFDVVSRLERLLPEGVRRCAD